MKKIVLLILLVFGLFAAVFGTLNAIDRYYDNKIKAAYADHIGDAMLTEKNEGLILQRESLDRSDNIQIHGSSELGTLDIYTHPSNMFKAKSEGFQVNLVGRGYSQSIIHAINLGALKGTLQGKKMVFILSPQWFSANGLGSNELEMNFSELQFYSVMFDKDLNKSIKTGIAERTSELLKDNKNYTGVYIYSMLYNKNNLLSKTGLTLLTPYSRFKLYILSVKDKIQSYKAILSLNYIPEEKKQAKNYDWDKELIKADEVGREKSNNNEYGIENAYYDKYIKVNLSSNKGIDKNQSYLKSPEYDDLKLLLDVCKEKGIDPLFVSVPVQGKWYDYRDFSKEDRQAYYKKVSDLIKSYDYQVLDLSSHEYDEHFLKDVMHLGWKGWIYIDKAIDEYYHNDKQ